MLFGLEEVESNHRPSFLFRLSSRRDQLLATWKSMQLRQILNVNQGPIEQEKVQERYSLNLPWSYFF